MSLAYKLWKIGNVLTEEDVWNAMMNRVDHSEDDDYQYLNIDIETSGDKVIDISLNKNAISHGKLFITKKIGGTSNSYYLYPNLKIQNSPIKKKQVKPLVNTLKYGMQNVATDHNCKIVKVSLYVLEHLEKYMDRAEAELTLSDLLKRQTQLLEKEQSFDDRPCDKEFSKLKKEIIKAEKNVSDAKKEFNEWNPSLLNVCSVLVSLPKSNYLLWLSLNGKTFYELMPEIKDNWFKCPVIAGDLRKGYDAFTNLETDVGYKPEVKVFSYDNYHDSMSCRLSDNLPLSLESARAIKFAWMYLVHNLVFYFSGLEYVLIPNVLSDDPDLYRAVLKRFQRANENSNKKRTTLQQYSAQEKRLEKDISKIAKGKSEQNKNKLQELTRQRQELQQMVDQTDTGFIRQLDEQIEEVGDLRDSITIDYLFAKIDRTSLSFEIKGSIEDIIPSRIRTVVKRMRDHHINDQVKLGRRNPDETLLQDYFHKKELLHIVNRSTKKNVNTILQEKLYVARLLLTDIKIDLDSLLARFEENRCYGYDMKKRLTKDGVYQWIEFPQRFVYHDDTIFNFLKRLDKIKG